MREFHLRISSYLKRNVRRKLLTGLAVLVPLGITIFAIKFLFSITAGFLAPHISSVIQKESNPETKTAEIVIMTHPAREKAVQEALRETEHLNIVREISNFVRVEA